MQTIYPSAHAKLLTVVLAPTLFLLFILGIYAESIGESLFLSCFGILILLFYNSLITLSGYEFNDDHLLVRLSYFRKRIPYTSMRKVEIGNHLWYVGYKFATGWKNSVVLEFNKYDDILLSPVDPEKFVEDLQKHVPGLEITHK